MSRRRVPNRNRREPKHDFRVNDQIRIPQVRLVGENVEEVAQKVGIEIKAGEVYNTRDVKRWAEIVELDLVEISPKAKPPVKVTGGTYDKTSENITISAFPGKATIRLEY